MGNKYGRGSEYEVTVGGRDVFQASRSFMVTDPLTGVRTRKRVTGTGASESEAWDRLEANVVRFKLRMNDGGPAIRKKPSKPSQTVEEWIYEWHRRLRLRGSVTETVARKYLRALEIHVTPHIGSLSLVELRLADLEKLFHETLPSKVRADGSQLLGGGGLANVFKPLNLALKDAVDREQIERNPMSGLRQPTHERPSEEVNKTAKHAGKLLSHLSNHPDQARHLLPFIGLRRSEKLGLTWSNIVNLSDNTGKARMRIRQQLARHEDGGGYYINRKLKTKASERTIPIPEPFLSALRKEKQKQDGWKKSDAWAPEAQFEDMVFTTEIGRPITQNRDNRDWHELLSSYGFDYWRGHLNRHITATMLAKQSPPVPIGVVKEILGHNSEAMSLYYTELDEEAMVEPLTRYGAWLDFEKEAADFEDFSAAPRFKATGSD